ncbi:hypothetical protein Noc_2033 [Nitrosococcus oceani ATCC 19707]|uniref:Uncharacterized protein n=2 Tax=Nitrosococcus oceani TaxID=1229 RepID=Q3J9K3_NITOC|nr:SBBP repeat-containing protein [Nitrosococcus oceani]ABA58493.1 hypothetical protein Noc_2033 [Nitrosococcus oceani ATCC 19707]EDZ67932.1 hypothetical protein NOC27_1259 [Nitrosococcus oceani AFC27]KFI19097.1 hypothetical protein IB75_10840 [Nitrosococcus oceani C-27]GEM18890.1 hypothetical protein NONS58_02550 [Nitrosococcus oceani]
MGGKEFVDIGSSIAADTEGHAYVTGWSSSVSFPILNAAQPQPGHANNGSSDAFIAKLSPDGHLVYATYLGGCCDERGRGIAVDRGGNAYVTGWTSSPDFPILNPLQPALAGSIDVFVTKILDTRLPDCPTGIFSPNYWELFLSDNRIANGGSMRAGDPLTLLLNSLKSNAAFDPLAGMLGDLFPCPLSGVNLGRKASNRLPIAEINAY